MRKMFFVPKGVEYDLATSSDLFLLLFIYPVGIGDVGKIADAKTKHRHLHMPNMDRNKRDIADLERVTGCPVSLISVGFGRDFMIDRRKV